jgi:membrane protein
MLQRVCGRNCGGHFRSCGRWTFHTRAVRSVRSRAIGLLLVLLTGVTLAGLVIVHAALSRADLDAVVPGAAPLLEWLASLLVTIVLFTSVYWLLPPARVPLRAALYGGIVTALLVTVGSVLVGAYVAHKSTLSAFGTASSLVMLLLWVHYAAHVFFYGAALTRVHMLEQRQVPMP